MENIASFETKLKYNFSISVVDAVLKEVKLILKETLYVTFFTVTVFI